MNNIEKVIYTASTHTTGGRDGIGKSSDEKLNVLLSRPGSAGKGTNPEQLFAVGWSACYIGALGIAVRKLGTVLPEDTYVDAEVDLGVSCEAYQLQARLFVCLPGIESRTAQKLVELAHHICPYSNATKGKIDVVTTII